MMSGICTKHMGMEAPCGCREFLETKQNIYRPLGDKARPGEFARNETKGRDVHICAVGV